MEAFSRWCSDEKGEAHLATDALVPESLRLQTGDVDISLAVKHVLGGETLQKFWRYTHFPVVLKPRFFQIHTNDGKYYLTWDSQNRRRKKYGDATVDFADIQEVRSGAESLYLCKKGHGTNSIEIRYKESRYLRIECPSSASWKFWLIGLMTLRERASAKMKERNVSRAINTLWLQLTEHDQFQLTDYGSILNLLTEMNFRCDSRYLKMLCQDPTQVEYLEFEKLIGRLLASRELMETFYKTTIRDDIMSEMELLDFVKDVQMERDPTRMMKLLLQAVPAELTIPVGITDIGFCRAMMSGTNSLWDGDLLKKGAYPLDQPAYKYWIKTSYNPCFMHPWSLISPITKLRKVLREGYRCLEFDVYESSNSSLVVPTSAKPAKSIPLDKILRICKEYAFQQHHTPIFIFLSIDASLPLCAELGQKLRSIFGRDLLQLSEMAKELGDKSEGKLDWDFRIEDFNDRFIFGGKRIHMQMRHIEFQDETLQLDPLFSPVRNHPLGTRVKEFLPKPSAAGDGVNPFSRSSVEIQPHSYASKSTSPRSGSDRSLRRTGANSRVYDRSRGLLALELRQYLESIVLLDQSALIDMSDSRPAAERQLDHRTVLSCSPDQYKDVGIPRPCTLYKVSPLSLLSSVTSPPSFAGWGRGYQMISHFNAHGITEWVQRGRFLENGNCGYILKQSSRGSPAQTHRQRELTVSVLAGRQLPIPVVSRQSHQFIVRLLLMREGRSEERVTTVTENSGLDPRWNDRLVFEVDAGELAKTAGNEDTGKTATLPMLVVEVRMMQQDTSESICGTAIPLNCVKPGLRWLPLWNLDGRTIPWCGLIVHTETRYLKGAAAPAAGAAQGGAEGAANAAPSRRNSAKDLIMEQRRHRRLSAAAPLAGLVAQRRASLSKE